MTTDEELLALISDEMSPAFHDEARLIELGMQAWDWASIDAELAELVDDNSLSAVRSFDTDERLLAWQWDDGSVDVMIRIGPDRDARVDVVLGPAQAATFDIETVIDGQLHRRREVTQTGAVSFVTLVGTLTMVRAETFAGAVSTGWFRV